jgi:antitoxin (DNA-binding transcriptional repressor) of toxin-antitoxin stability system
VVKFLSLRDLRNTPGALWRKLRGGDTVAITSEGRPRALVIGLDPEDLPETVRLLERLRAQQAVSRMRADARASGAAELDADGIATEIKAARRARRR